MSGVTLTLAPCSANEKPTGVVAHLRMPMPLSAMDAMNRFVEKAYGPGCVCKEEPKGWLRISTPEKREDTP